MVYKKISQETITANRKKYKVFQSLSSAQLYASETSKSYPKTKRIYQLPNGNYVVRVT